MDDLTVGSQGARLAFGLPQADLPPSHRIVVPVLVGAGGIQASSEVTLESWGGGAKALVSFFMQLYEHWRGWTGTKDWRDDQGVVELSATHDGRGAILIKVTLAPMRHIPDVGAWECTVYVATDGESCREVARSLQGRLASLNEH